VRQRAVRAESDDGRERGALGPQPPLLDLDVECHLALGAPDEPARQDHLQRRVGQERCSADLLDLACILDRAQLLHQPAGLQQRDLRPDELGQVRVRLDAHVDVVEAQPQRAVGQRRGDAGQQVGAGDLAVEVGHLVGRLGQVAEVGDEHANRIPPTPDQGRARRPGEPGGPPHVDQVGDEQRVELALAHQVLQPRHPRQIGHLPSSSFSRSNATR